MIEFGKTLREAREAKGYTVSQIAEMTHLKSSLVEQLENEDFSSIAAPIYGRGFVKLYCEAIGLEAKPLVDEFMAIMNGEREIAIKERTAAETSADPRPETPPPPPSAPAPGPDLFAQDEPEAPIAAIPPPCPVQLSEPVQTQPLSRYAAPLRENPTAVRMTAFNPRIVLLAALALILLIVLVLGIRSLYRATAPDAPRADEPAATAETISDKAKEEKPAPEPAPAAKAAESAPAAKTAPRARQQKIPSLYID